MQLFGAVTGEMVRAAAQGGGIAREQLLTALLPRIRAMVIVRLAPTPDQFHAVDDLAQQSLIAVSDGLAGLREATPEVLASFVSTIVARSVAGFIRREAADKNRGPVRSLDSTFLQGVAPAALRDLIQASALTPRSAAGRAEQVRRVLTGLGQLPEEHHQIIILAFFDQLPMSEIAEQLRISRPAASMLLIRAVGALRRLVTGSSKLGGSHGH